MNIPNLSKLNGLVAVGKTFLSTHRPEILLGTSLATTIGAVVAAARGGYKSGRVIQEIEMNEQRDVEVKEMIQLTWPNYLPAAGFTVGALGSTTALHLVHVKEKKALATAALAAVDEVKREFKKYEEEETAGVVSRDEKQAILEGRATNTPIGEDKSSHVQYSDGIVEEMYLVRDKKSGRDIWSNEARIQEAVNNVNKWIAKNGDCELNTFYSAAGFEQLPDGDDWGWSGDFCELTWERYKAVPPGRGFDSSREADRQRALHMETLDLMLDKLLAFYDERLLAPHAESEAS